MGTVQGLTEFLPVSSSGHLRLLENLVALPPSVSNLAFEVLVHGGTLVAVVIWLRRELLYLAGALYSLPGWLRSALGGTPRPLSGRERLLLAVLTASLPTAVTGLALKRLGIEKAGPTVVALCLIITGVLNLTVRRKALRATEGSAGLDTPASSFDAHHAPDDDIEKLTMTQAFLIGTVQGLAILPGISRSGSTIAAGSRLGLSLEGAARFSFLISVPAVGGATLLELKELAASGAGNSPETAVMLLGALAAFILGLVTLRWLFAALRRDSYHYFAYYCWFVAAVVLGLSFRPG